MLLAIIVLPADEIYTYRTQILGFIPVGATIDLMDVEDLNVFVISLYRLDIDSTCIPDREPTAVPEDEMKVVAINLSLPELKRDTFLAFNAERQ